VLAERDAILLRQAPGASGRGLRAAADASDGRGDRRQTEPVAETIVHRSGQLPGRELARDALFSPGTAASANGADGHETPLRHLLPITPDRGSAWATEFTDRAALSAAGIKPDPDAGNPTTRVVRGCDGRGDRVDSQRDGRSLPGRGYDDPATAGAE